MHIFNVTEAARYLRRSVKTLQRWDRDGVLTSARTESNRRYYTKDQLDSYLRVQPTSVPRKVVAYVRVSSQAQKPDLRNQRSILEEFTVSAGIPNVEFVEEIGGGLNFKRPKFLNLIDGITSGAVSKLIIAHRDRLCRFGFELLEWLCSQNSCELLVLNQEKQSPEQEMVQDLMTIIHCFSSRLYGLRNYKKTLAEALKK